MANLITHSLSFTKELATELFFQPLFVNDLEFKSMVTVITNVKGSRALNQISALDKITKVYQQGTSFTSSSGVTITQKTLTVGRLKAEVKQNGRALYDSVMEELVAQGIDSNNVEGTVLEEIIVSLFMPGLKRDRDRQGWLGDTTKETITSSIRTGTLDTDYNIYQGWWPRIIDAFDDSSIPTAQKTDMNSTTYLDTAAVAQRESATLTGTSGTANIPINGTNYLATFTTSLTVTATNFVTSHAATILAREGKCVVTSSGAIVIVDAGIAGFQIDVLAGVNVSGDLDSTTAASTANVATGDIKTDGAKLAFQDMWDNATPELRKFKGQGLQIYVTASMEESYIRTLEALGSEQAHTMLVAGTMRNTWRGIPIIPVIDWDTHIANDFGSVRPHRALMTIPKNLVWGTDGSDDETNMEFFYEKKDEENYFRVAYMAGTQFVDEELISAAYA